MVGLKSKSAPLKHWASVSKLMITWSTPSINKQTIIKIQDANMNIVIGIKLITILAQTLAIALNCYHRWEWTLLLALHWCKSIREYFTWEIKLTWKLHSFLRYYNVSIRDLPNCLVSLHQHRPICPREWHGVVADVDMTATQQYLSTDLQPLVHDSQ